MVVADSGVINEYFMTIILKYISNLTYKTMLLLHSVLFELLL